MEIRDQIAQTESRLEAFLKNLPREKKHLVKMYGRYRKTEKRCLPALFPCFLLLALLYVVFGLTLPYTNCWIWNAVIAVVLFVGCIVLAIFLQRRNRDKAKAIADSIPELTAEYDAILARLAGLKKAEKKRIAAEKKAERAAERAREAEKAANKAAMDAKDAATPKE